jgi:hypothetical protein
MFFIFLDQHLFAHPITKPQLESWSMSRVRHLAYSKSSKSSRLVDLLCGQSYIQAWIKVELCVPCKGLVTCKWNWRKTIEWLLVMWNWKCRNPLNWKFIYVLYAHWLKFLMLSINQTCQQMCIETSDFLLANFHHLVTPKNWKFSEILVFFLV